METLAEWMFAIDPGDPTIASLFCQCLDTIYTLQAQPELALTKARELNSQIQTIALHYRAAWICNLKDSV